METRAHYALIGAFTLAVIAAAFSFVFWFSGGDKPANRKVYRLIFTSSVSGLSRGAQVLFNGLPVGEVTKIDLADDPASVYAIIEVNPRTPVKTDPRARLEFTGLTGVASVALTGGSASASELVATGKGPAEITAERSDFQSIVETLQNLSGKLDKILDKADILVSENAGAITNTVKNVETFSQALAQNSDSLKGFLATIADVGKSIKPFVESLDRNSGNVDSIMKDTHELVAKLNVSATKIDAILDGAKDLIGQPGSKGMFDNVADAAKSIRKLADNLDQRTKDISAGIKQFTGPGLRQYEALASDARKTLDEINQTVKSLEKNPQQIIFGAKPQVPEYSAR